MKVSEIILNEEAIPSLDVDALVQHIKAKIANYPKGSLTPRSVVATYALSEGLNRDEIEKIVADLDKSVTAALSQFALKQAKKLKQVK